MRVKFSRDYKAPRGEESYTKGQVVHLDQGLAAQLVADGYAADFPLSSAEVAEQAKKYHANDDQRTPAQIADRVPQVTVLTGDTRSDTEQQRGNDDSHEVRKQDEATAERVAEQKAKADEKAKAAEAKAAADKAAAERK